MNLTLKETLNRRERVLTYLKAEKLAADKELGLINLNMNDEQWNFACKNYMDACFNLRTARMGSNWMEHFIKTQSKGY